MRHAAPPKTPFLLALVALASIPVVAAAQAPGYQGPGPREIRLEYRAEVVGQLNELMAKWADAYSRDDLDALADLYVEDAVVFPPGSEQIRGVDGIRTWLSGTLPGHGQAEAFLVDFDASGGMAMAQSNYRIGVREAGRAGRMTAGDLVTILILRGNRWKIRSQIFLQHR